jgi:TolB-like protein
LAAVLAADVVGYSRLMGRNEQDTLKRLKAHRAERLEPAVAHHGGRVVKLTGDGALVEFGSAVDALAAAIEFQQAMAGANAGQPSDAAIVFRIGLHLGDLIVDGDDLYGDGVNVAARLEAEAPAGGIVISGDVRNAVDGKVKASLRDLGELALKNIERPVRAFGVTWTATDWPAPANAAAPSRDAAAALADKPSIAVLPFANMSGDPEQEYFVDGIAEDIITELSRFREFAVIARNSTFTYKGKHVDVATVGRELNVEYVLEGSARKAGNRVRITAQLISAADNLHLWAERYDRNLDDIFAVQEEITRTVVASIASEVAKAEVIGQARQDRPSDHVRRLPWRARGLIYDGMRRGDPAGYLQGLDAAKQAVTADESSLNALALLTLAYRQCHLYRWGPEPERALDSAWATAQRMTKIDPVDVRTLTSRGGLRVLRGDVADAIADLLRALEINPNSTAVLFMLAFSEATAGMNEAAKTHALLALRLSPRDYLIGNAQLSLAMANFNLREYEEAARWTEMAIQSAPVAPIRRALMIACTARSGDLQRAQREHETLKSFAPGFIGSLFHGENKIFSRREDMEHLLDGLRLAGLGG